MINRDIEVRTGTRRGLFDLTSFCAEFVAGQGDGLLQANRNVSVSQVLKLMARLF